MPMKAEATIVPHYVDGVAGVLIKQLKLDDAEEYHWKYNIHGTLSDGLSSGAIYLFDLIREEYGNMPLADALLILSAWSEAGVHVPPGFISYQQPKELCDMTPDELLRHLALWVLDEAIALEFTSRGMDLIP